MFSSKFTAFVILAIAGSSVDAAPALYKGDIATPALAAREPQFSVNIPNNIPVSGSFPNGISITPQTPSGSIVTSNRNSTFPFNLFGRDEPSTVLAAREPQFSVNIPNNIPVSGQFPNGISIAPQTPSGSIVTSNRNGTFPFNLFGRDEATPALAAREPQFSVNIPNNIPVSGTFRNGLTITPQTPSGSIVTGNRNSTLFGQLGFKREDATPALAAREPQFSVNIPNTVPVSGTFRDGLTITPQTPSGSIVTGNRNSTLFGSLFGRDDATPVLQAREPQFSVNIPNNIPVSGNFPNGISITPQTPSGSIVTSNRNGTFPFNLFGRDEATPVLAAREPQFSVNIPNSIPVSGSFPNGISITPQTPSGSIVTSNRNGTFPFNLFGRDI